jgi:hypothetical protein
MYITHNAEFDAITSDTFTISHVKNASSRQDAKK